MLINCPECGKEISDKSLQCIHCGFPLDNASNNICIINGVSHDFTKVLECVQKKDKIWGLRLIVEACDFGFDNAKQLYAEIESTGKIPHNFTPARWSEFITTPTLRCPKCGSAAITTGARGISCFWGAIGASKTVNRCGNCGHNWEPRR